MMFVIERVSEGYLTGSGTDQMNDDFSGNFSFNPDGEPDYQPSDSGPFTAKINTLDIKTGTSEGHTITWNRMSDGALVMVSNAGFSYSYQTVFVKSVLYSMDQIGTINNSTYVGNGDEKLWGWYRNIEIAGGQYKARLMSVGYNASTSNQSDAKKYIQDSVDGEWTGQFLDSYYGPATGEDYPYGYFNSKTKKFSYSKRKELGSYSITSPNRLMLEPTGEVPLVTVEIEDLGTITEPQSVDFTFSMQANYTVYVNDEQKATGSGTSVTVDLSEYWEELEYSACTLKVVTEANGYKCGGRVAFTKSVSMLKVTGNPLSFDTMPTFIKVVDSCVVPDGAIITREVCNNANDAKPTWETYEENSNHGFQNKTKTAEKWAVSWRVTIDNSYGNSQAQIRDGVTVAVMRQGEI